MVHAGKPCPLCRETLAPHRLGEISGDEGALRITVRAMPSIACPNNHSYFVAPGFPLWLMNHLVDEDEASLPAGDAKGLILKKYVCHDCGQPLAPKEDHRHTFHVPVTYTDGTVFSVDLSMPVYKCTGCGKEQLHSLEELRKLTPAALVHAFKGAGIKGPA